MFSKIFYAHLYGAPSFTVIGRRRKMQFQNKKEKQKYIQSRTFKKDSISAERGKITIVLPAESVGNVSKKHNWINYIFISLHPFKSEDVLHCSFTFCWIICEVARLSRCFRCSSRDNMSPLRRTFCESDILFPRQSYEKEASKAPNSKLEFFYSDF